MITVKGTNIRIPQGESGSVVFAFKDLITDYPYILKKDVTFTKRTEIWDSTIEFIKNRFLIGYGIENKIVRLSKISVVHAHNIFLEITNGNFIYLLNDKMESLSS